MSEGIKYFYKRIQERKLKDFLTYYTNHLQTSAEVVAKRWSVLRKLRKTLVSH